MQTIDVSEAGLAYLSRRADPVGSFLRVNLRVFDDPNSWVDVDGVVKRLDRHDGVYTHGVQFVGISEPAAVRLRHYVEVAGPMPAPEPPSPQPEPKNAAAPRPRPREDTEPSMSSSTAELQDLFRKALDQLE